MEQRDRFKQEVKNYQGLVYSIAYGYLLNPEDARDVVQEAFLKAHEEPRFLGPDFNRKGWLVAVTRNLALNAKRSFLRGLKSIFRMKNWFERDEHPSAEDAAMKTEDHQELRSVMEKLSAEEQEILTLRFAADLSYEEIAAQMNIKIGTVMSRLARAKEKLGIALNREQTL